MFKGICDGYESVWDGNNYVGRYDRDASRAIETLTHSLEEYFFPCSDKLTDVYDSREYLAECSLAEQWPEGTSLSEAIADIERLVEENVYIDGAIEDGILSLVDSAISNPHNDGDWRLPEYMWADLLAIDDEKYHLSVRLS